MVARIQTNTNIINKTLLIKKIKLELQPDQNTRQKIILDENIFKYSPKKKNANAIEEYSVLYPATSSASASGKSNGILFVSIKNTIKTKILVNQKIT
jgi:hypothetical protein